MEISTTYGDSADLILLLLFGFYGMLFLFAVALYVVKSIFLMKLLKVAGHRNPVAAWIPIWDSVALYEVGGIRQPWIWVLLFTFGSLATASSPIFGFIVALAILVCAVIIQVYVAKAVQRAIGIDSVGGVVLSVLLTTVWIVWISLEAAKRDSYDLEAAIEEGGSMPLNWFRETDPRGPFRARSEETTEPSKS